MQHKITIQLDDSIYQPLMEQVGKNNLNQFISKLIEPYLLMNQNVINEKNLSQASKDSHFDEVFGLLKADNHVTLEEMDATIRQRGAGLCVYPPKI